MYVKNFADELDSDLISDIRVLEATWTGDLLILAAWRLGNMRGRQWFKRPGGSSDDIKALLAKHEGTELEVMRKHPGFGTARAIEYGEREALVVQGFRRFFAAAPVLAAFLYGKEAKRARFDQELMQLIAFFAALEENEASREQTARTTEELKNHFDAAAAKLGL